MGLSDVLTRVRENFDRNAYQNREAVRSQVVIPILRELGWDAEDPEVFHLSYRAGGGLVSIALFKTSSVRAPSVMISVKGPDESIGDSRSTRQLLDYCRQEATRMAVLTNGSWWSFHLPTEGGEFVSDRRVSSARLDEDRERVESVLNRYLAFDRHQSGEAIGDAQRDYRGLSKRKAIEKNLPKIWDEMLTAPPDSLVNLVADRYAESHAYQPDPQLVEKFLRSAAPPVRDEDAPLIPQTPRRRHRDAGPVRDGVVLWHVNEFHGSTRTVADGFVAIFGALHRIIQDRGFEILSEQLARNTRTLLAKQKLNLSFDRDPNAPVVISAKRLECGWWVGTHSSTPDKLEKIQEVKAIIRSRLGIRVRIELHPNSSV